MKSSVNNRTGLALIYGVSLKTLNKMIKEHGIKLPENRRVLTPSEILEVYNRLGFPEGKDVR